MPGIEIKGRSKIANYRHGGRAGFKHAGSTGVEHGRPVYKGRKGRERERKHTEFTSTMS